MAAPHVIALDTNLLIYAHRASTPEHAAATKAIETAAETAAWGFSSACLAEFWSVVTHPSCPPRPSTADQARRFIQALADAGARIWAPGPDFGSRLLQEAEDLRIKGPRIFDLQIAMVAFENGATELWSHDRNFQTVPGLRLRDPLA